MIDFEELDRLEAAAAAAASPEGPPAPLRWAVRSGAWQPGEAEWRFLLGRLPEPEQAHVQRFKFEEDRKRALLSRLLQRAAVCAAVGLPYDTVVLRRTKGNKPFLAVPHSRPDAPNFNFNVSHEGDYVILATENVCIVGADVAAPQQVRRRGQPVERAADFFANFESVCSEREWRAIRAQPTDALQLAAFRRHWSLKEAFVKARGDGLGFEPLRRAEFDFGADFWGPEATVAVDGRPQPQWRFFLEEREEHWLSVARGPPSDVVDAHGEFVQTFRRPRPPAEEYTAALLAPNPPFTIKMVRDLLPGAWLPEYDATLSP
eukprot:EG_transcript_16237